MLAKLFRRSKPVRKTAKLNLVSLETRDVPANFAVMNTNDSGPNSLRAAVSAANTNPGSDAIIFDAAFFNAAKTISLTTGQLVLTGTTAIYGPGKDLLTISGTNTTRMLRFSPTSNGTLSLFDLTLADGRDVSTLGGGALYVDGAAAIAQVIVSDCTLRDNSSSLGGGAVRAGNGTTSIDLLDCTFQDNTAKFGGAAYLTSDDSLNIVRSLFDGNTSDAGGGAIFMGTSELSVLDSTFTNNKAGFDGGAIHSDFGSTWSIRRSAFFGNTATNGGALSFENATDFNANRTISNCTFTGNNALFSGGAIDFLDMSASDATSIDACTIVGNTAGYDGGGISFHNFENGQIELTSSIVAGNSAAENGSDFFSGTANSRFEFFHSAWTSTEDALVILGNGNIGQLPLASMKLGALSDNGGLTLTMALADDSPLRNKGVDPSLDGKDQRGEPRVNNGAADIGAFETRQQFIVTNNKDSGVGSLRQAVLDANAFVSSGDLITFDPVYFSVPRQITLTSGPITSQNNLEIDGPGAKSVIISGNNASNGLYFTGGTGTSILRDVTVANNSEFAIHASVADFVLDNCIVRDNLSPVFLSAVFIQGGNVTVSNSSITGNSNGGHGGGIEFFSTTSATLRNTTISNNIADSGGGVKANAAVQIINSTISGNSAATTGGGISFTNLAASPLIVNSTITNNTAGTQGGGIHVPGLPAQSLEVVSSVISGNIAPSAKDVFTFHVTTPVNARSSAFGSLSGIALFNDLGGNITPGTDLKLNPLMNTGGLGSTHSLRPGSPLLQAGSNPFNLATDQRGQPRNSQGGVDIGAVEAIIAPQVSITIDDGSAQRSMVRKLTATFDRVVTFGPLAFDVVRQGPNNPSGPLGIVVDTSLSTASQTIATISWSDAGFTQHGSLVDGQYFLAGFNEHITDGNGLKLDGNGDGIGGDTGIYYFHRLFGDSNGDRTVDASDFADFGNAWGNTLPGGIFDFNADGLTDAGDFAEFGNRFGVTLI